MKKIERSFTLPECTQTKIVRGCLKSPPVIAGNDPRSRFIHVWRDSGSGPEWQFNIIRLL